MVEVEHVNTHRSKKEMQNMSLFEHFLTVDNEKADELVKEFKLDPSITFDEKNIRRRIYDALNVLMAMDIITRDKKNIR